jgi:hypothetical protein
MEGLTPESNTTDEWLEADNQPTKDKQIVFNFAIFCGKTPKQIVYEFNDSSKKQFADYYGEQLLKYASQLQKKLSANSVREHVDIIRSFFKYNKLPIKFGISAHMQFFFK